MAEIDDFDLDRSTAQAWAEFTGRLAEVISMIDESADLTIRSFSASADPPFVRLSSPARLTIRAEAAANASLGRELSADRGQTAALEERAGSRRTRDSPNFCLRLVPGRGRRGRRARRRCPARRVRRAAPGLPRPRPAGRDPPHRAVGHRGTRRRHRVATGTCWRPSRTAGAAASSGVRPAGRGVAMIAVLPADRGQLDALVEAELGARSGASADPRRGGRHRHPGGLHPGLPADRRGRPGRRAVLGGRARRRRRSLPSRPRCSTTSTSSRGG